MTRCSTHSPGAGIFDQSNRTICRWRAQSGKILYLTDINGHLSVWLLTPESRPGSTVNALY